MLDIKEDPQAVRNFFENLNEENKRGLFTLLQNFNKRDFFSILDNSTYISLIREYKNEIPYLNEIDKNYDIVKSFLMDPANRNQIVLFVSNPNQISDALKGLLDDLHKPYKKYKKWLMKANELLQPIEVTGPSPNRESLHFKVAQEMVDAISRVWCIQKVIMFGSVARGEERIDSDIDLAVELFGDVRHSRKFVKGFIDRMIGDVLEPLRKKYINVIGGEKGIWDIINLSTAPKNNLKMFEAKDFFTNSLSMFERTQPELVIDGNTFKFEVGDILGWVHMRNPGIYCLLFNGENPMQMKVIGMHGSDVGWVGLLNFELRGNDESYFRVMLTEAKQVFAFDDDAEEEFKNLHFWFEIVQWYHSWGEFDYKTMKFVILPSNWPHW
ncbi:MAG: nucleotidyltransferase domain-containing protein [Desulfosporosinus sp.]|nr:nucleotidyltransferase domain-containing protein [Desulfosporosinus sp.]